MPRRAPPLAEQIAAMMARIDAAEKQHGPTAALRDRLIALRTKQIKQECREERRARRAAA